MIAEIAEKRFSGKIGEEYELFLLACPHCDELEMLVGEIIKNEYNNSDKNVISAVEIGCGLGITTKNILISDSRVNVTAIDNERIMLKQAKENLKSYIEDGRLKLIMSDALEFVRSLPDSSFDAIASVFTLHNFEQKYRNELINEIFRVLVPGGLFINADKYARDDNALHYNDLKWQINQFIEKYSGIGRFDLINEWINHYLVDNKDNIIMKEGKSFDILKKSGFRNIKKVYRKHMEAIVVCKK
ncbi:MAG: class I SAM-dependent methyltransferase [Candidatus Micrarchaeota archaeon]|nr:class I SAM-dependent methyltransferase [Candidatus Micrarchaeota archaeon]